LSELGKQLKGLKALTLYSQLFAGTTSAAHADATSFLASQHGLKELHLLDVFAPHPVFADLLAAVSAELKFLEISFTFRHSDEEFLKSVPGKEIVGGLKKGLLGLTACVTAPEVTEDDEVSRWCFVDAEEIRAEMADGIFLVGQRGY